MWVNPFRTIYVKFKPFTLSDFTCWGLPVFQTEVYRIKNLKNEDYEGRTFCFLFWWIFSSFGHICFQERFLFIFF